MAHGPIAMHHFR